MTKRQKLLKNKIIVQNCIIFCLIVTICLTITSGFYIILGNKMKPGEYETVQYEYIAVEDFHIDKAVFELRRLFNTPHIYIEKNIKDSWSKANPLLRLVIIDQDLKEASKQQYIMVYAYELTHIKYATINETYTEYKSIITLYESGIEYFKQIAWNEAVLIMRGYQNGNENDCGAQLREYFGV